MCKKRDVSREAANLIAAAIPPFPEDGSVFNAKKIGDLGLADGRTNHVPRDATIGGEATKSGGKRLADRGCTRLAVKRRRGRLDYRPPNQISRVDAGAAGAVWKRNFVCAAAEDGARAMFVLDRRAEDGEYSWVRTPRFDGGKDVGTRLENLSRANRSPKSVCGQIGKLQGAEPLGFFHNISFFFVRFAMQSCIVFVRYKRTALGSTRARHHLRTPDGGVWPNSSGA